MVPNLTGVVTVAYRRSERSGRERAVCRGVLKIQTRRDQSQRVQRPAPDRTHTGCKVDPSQVSAPRQTGRIPCNCCKSWTAQGRSLGDENAEENSWERRSHSLALGNSSQPMVSKTTQHAPTKEENEQETKAENDPRTGLD